MPARLLGHRSLAALTKTASTARLLNLAAVAEGHFGDMEYRARPFFQTPLLNAALIVKHSVRAHERGQFHGDAPFISTKVIIPFDRDDMELGGRTVFVGQKHWEAQLRVLAHDAPTLERDFKVLRALDELPSLDPFLVREHLSRRGHQVAACYLTIAAADIERMRKSVASEIEQLISLAFEDSAQTSQTARLVELLLTNEADARLEPLRLTLKLEGDAYREGVFSWKGFLYYKWVLSELRAPLARVAFAIRDLRVERGCNSGALVEIERAKTRLMRAIGASERAAVEALQIYDEAFQGLVRRNDPGGFRDFLLRSPRMFLSLGQSVGGISHIASYWNYRYPEGPPASLRWVELMELLVEFCGSLAHSVAEENGVAA